MTKIAVLKFGGTSMGSAETMNSCLDVAKERIKEGQVPFLVVSAISKMTDTLLKMLSLAKAKNKKELYETFEGIKKRHFEVLNNLTKNKKLLEEYTKILNKKFSTLKSIYEGIMLLGDYNDKIHANVASYGEDLSSDLMELCIIESGLKGKKITSSKFVKTFDNDYLASNIDFTKTKRAFKKIKGEVEKGTIFVMTGFFGSNSHNEIALLGRGGSDFSGSIAGVSLEANVVEIWTDADGIMSADPRVVKNAVLWKTLNKDIASEMARAGAKVLHPKTIVASHYGIDVMVKNLFNKKSVGTLISEKKDSGIKGVVADGGYSIINLENQDMFGNTGFMAKVGIIANNNNIPIDMVSTSETCVSFTVKTNLLGKEISNCFKEIANLSILNNVAKISIIGENIANSDVMAKIFTTLKEKKINILLTTLSQSKNNIGLMVGEKEKDNVIAVLHEALIK